MWHYARATGFARKGALADARREVDALATIERSADCKPITDWAVPAKEIVQTARAVASGRVADASGDLRVRSRLIRRRWRCRMPCPTSSRRTGTTQCASRSAPRCCAPARRARPSRRFAIRWRARRVNGWALRGLVEVYRQRGDAPALAATRKRFESTWLGPHEGPALSQQ